jgi:hypothetical protein
MFVPIKDAAETISFIKCRKNRGLGIDISTTCDTMAMVKKIMDRFAIKILTISLLLLIIGATVASAQINIGAVSPKKVMNIQLNKPSQTLIFGPKQGAGTIRFSFNPFIEKGGVHAEFTSQYSNNGGRTWHKFVSKKIDMWPFYYTGVQWSNGGMYRFYITGNTKQIKVDYTKN